MPARPRSKYWCFTLNNPSPEEEDGLKTFLLSTRYAIYQIEQAGTGTVHCQGYFVLPDKKDLAIVRKSGGLARAHFESRKGSHSQAKTYCCKEETRVRGPYTFGDDSDVPDGKGARTDLAEVQAAIKNGASEAELADKFFSTYLRYHSGIRNVLRLRPSRCRHAKTRVSVFYGDTGSGKSFRAGLVLGEAYWAIRPTQGGNMWWDNCAPEQSIIIDEFYGWLEIDFMLRLCDANPIQLKFHGGLMQWFGSRIIITSNKHPSLWYPNISDVHKRALDRRIEDIVWFKIGWHEVPEGVDNWEVERGELN